ncbi:hypothetical protein APHAL10511_003839 [Amanita phalloides]|nr:hypothetical protein APHAL10511_003839 [Amanita phalloides]
MSSSAPPSRTASISRASKHGSSLSRSQSLIKKNIAPHDLRPSDILIERFVAWNAIVKQLIAYFEGVADIQLNTARELTRLCAVIQVPFRAGNQFLGEGGLQDVFYEFRDKSRHIADQHANLGRTIDSSIVQHLQKLRTEIKAHIKNVQNDTGKLATSVAKERELSMRLVADLAHSISAFKNDPMHITAKSDPFVANQSVARQLQKQVHEENLLQKSIVIMQQNSAHFEEGIVRAIQSAWQTFDEWQSRASGAVQDTYRSLSNHLGSLPPDKEWISFAARSDHLLDPETPLRNPETIIYPSRDDSAVAAVHTGLLERKKRFTRAYNESYYVLTPAGFLHEFATSDPAAPGGATPIFSLFLPACTLGPPSSANSRSHKFHIEGSKNGTGTTKTGSFRRNYGVAWNFRARSREDMMEWWNDIRMLCARYLVASEQIERDGPVAAAVRAAGYLSGEEEEAPSSGDEGEGEGEDDGGELYVDSATHEDDQQYATPEKSHGGENGYARDTGPVENGEINPAGPSGPSRRQQEKAPDNGEGGYDNGGVQPDTEPFATHADEGADPTESRFTEGL